ncbi:MAG: zinc ribbon domain-containing protein [Fibrobacter sp.]|nr:zinc ribbon domain-containing protein [Fibrobacter sp.]HON09853.1 zinc ribbon domain-containing protein [Chitinispirillaceae bacterium]
MPIFEYRCKKCGKIFEELVTGNRDQTLPCPSCGSLTTEKLMSVIGGISMGRSSDNFCASSCANARSCAASGGGCCPHGG